MWASKLYAVHCDMVASSYLCQPNHSYAESMFRLHSDHTRDCVVAAVLHSPTKRLPCSIIIHRLVATQFSVLVYSICLVSTMCCDATITLHKRNTS